jgi:hypothetical protein
MEKGKRDNSRHGKCKWKLPGSRKFRSLSGLWNTSIEENTENYQSDYYIFRYLYIWYLYRILHILYIYHIASSRHIIVYFQAFTSHTFQLVSRPVYRIFSVNMADFRLIFNEIISTSPLTIQKS